MASLSHDLNFLPRLPVDVQLASCRVIAKINDIQADYIIYCAMAASRSQLSIELLVCSTSILPLESINSSENILRTTVDMEKLLVSTAAVEVSYDCGKFVCEGVYYSILDYLPQFQPSIKCIFVYVPMLNEENLIRIVADFVLIINNLALL